MHLLHIAGGKRKKFIRGYTNLYSVTTQGKIISHSEGKEEIMHPTEDKDGYLKVNLHRDGKSKTHKVHRVVATEFIPNPKRLPHVNHKDKNRRNCKKDNLEWCSISDNMKHKFKKSSIVELEKEDMIYLGGGLCLQE